MTNQVQQLTGENMELSKKLARAANKPFNWQSVESSDYKQYIANLRAIGCPEETIRDIIVADVNKLYESKRKALAGPKKTFEYWKPGAMMGAAFDPERTEKERALNQEKRALITELLGSAPDDKPDILAGAAGQLEAMFDFLPAEKRSKVGAGNEQDTALAKANAGEFNDTLARATLAHEPRA